MKTKTPMEILQARAEEYRNELAHLQSRYVIQHYRNSCGMIGVFRSMVGGGAAIEYLVGKASEVNCPYCKPKPKKKRK